MELTSRKDAIMPLRCGACGTEWGEHFSLPMLVEVFTLKLKAALCPKCGSKKALMKPQGDFWEDYVDVKGAAKALGVAPETIRRWVRRGWIPATYSGPKLVMKEADVRDFRNKYDGRSKRYEDS